MKKRTRKAKAAPAPCRRAACSGSRAKGRLALGALMLANTGCYHYHIHGNRVTPSTEPRSETNVAYLWGLVQPNDIVPENCPKKVPLAEVTAYTNLGYVLIGTVTLGTVLIHRIEWRCAKYPHQETDILQVRHHRGRG